VPPSWSIVKPTITATFDGAPVECLQFAVTFELNSIPSAQLDVAVGRNMRNGKPAAIHSLASVFNTKKPKVKVHLKLDAGDNPAGIDWGPVAKDGAIIFDGYATHSAPSITRGAAQVRIPLQHWLHDLDKASAISGSSHPGNPADFVYPSVFKIMGVSGVGGEPKPGWVALTDLETTISPGMLTSDGTWGIIKQWMQEVSRQDPVDQRLAKSDGNAKALAALDRMPTEISTALDLDSVDDGTSIGHGITQFLQASVARNNVNTTLWGKLIGEWCPSFFMAVAPRVDDALVIPFTGPLSGEDEQYITIPSTEYDAISSEVAAANSISAIGIYYTAIDGFGENFAPTSAPRNELAAVFPEATDGGMVMMKDAPIWLADSRQPGLYTGTATGIKERKPIKTAVGGEGSDEDAPQAAEQGAKDYKTMLGRFAQQWYAIEKTKNRIVEVRSRLRFDICPGTQVLIKGAREDFIAGDGLGVDYYGIVIRVSHTMSRRACFTMLTVGYLRTPAENQSELYSVTKPPLFTTGFYGAPLVTT